MSSLLHRFFGRGEIWWGQRKVMESNGYGAGSDQKEIKSLAPVDQSGNPYTLCQGRFLRVARDQNKESTGGLLKTVFLPYSSLVSIVEDLLFKNGSPGYENLWDPPKHFDYGIYREVKFRGASSREVFIQILTLLSRYIIHGWILRSWCSSTFLDSINHSEQRFDLSWDDSGVPFTNPPMNTEHLFKQWRWIIQFCDFASGLGIANLNSFELHYFPMSMKESPDNPALKEHRDQFIKMYEKLGFEKWYGTFPFDIQLTDYTDSRFEITITPRVTSDLFDRTIAHMGELEVKLAARMVHATQLWNKMRASDQIRDEDMDASLNRALRTQQTCWPGVFRKDRKLFTTSALMGVDQNWMDPVVKKNMIDIHNNTARIAKDHRGYARGYKGDQPLMELDESSRQSIDETKPDLQLFFQKVWPTSKQDKSHKKREKEAEKLPLTLLSKEDWKFSWRHYEDRSARLEFCTMLVKRYLERKTGRTYGLKPICDYLKPFVDTLPKSKRSPSPFSRKR